jgi:hypothetical protein
LHGSQRANQARDSVSISVAHLRGTIDVISLWMKLMLPLFVISENGPSPIVYNMLL